MYRKQARKEWRYDPREDPSHPHVHVERFKTYAEASIGKRLADLCAGCGKPVRGEIFKCGACMRAESQRRYQGHDVVLPAAPVVDEDLDLMRSRWLGKRFRVCRDGENIYGPVTRVERAGLDFNLWTPTDPHNDPWSARLDGADLLHVVPDDKPEVTTFGELSVGERFTCINGISDEVVCRKISDTDREWTNPKYGHNTSETYDHVAVKRVRS
jgi:hypothetical protein